MTNEARPPENETRLAIVAAPFDVTETEQPFGQRWGGEVVALRQEHLNALHEGKLVAVDVQSEYIVFLRLRGDSPIEM